MNITMHVGLYGTRKLRSGSVAMVKAHIFVFCSVVTGVTLGDDTRVITLGKKAILDEIKDVMQSDGPTVRASR